MIRIISIMLVLISFVLTGCSQYNLTEEDNFINKTNLSANITYLNPKSFNILNLKNTNIEEFKVKDVNFTFNKKSMTSKKIITITNIHDKGIVPGGPGGLDIIIYKNNSNMTYFNSSMKSYSKYVNSKNSKNHHIGLSTMTALKPDQSLDIFIEYEITLNKNHEFIK
jgi:hypothetical protein